MGGEQDEALLEAIDEGLRVLGESGKEATYYHIESKFGIRREEILRDPKRFFDALRSIYGGGAVTLQYAVRRSITRTFGLDSLPDNLLSALGIR